MRKKSDLVKVDDTWLKLAKLMFDPFTINFQNERLEQIKVLNPDEYFVKTMVHVIKKREIFIRAGEMICKYLEIDADNFLYQRENGESTILLS